MQLLLINNLNQNKMLKVRLRDKRIVNQMLDFYMREIFAELGKRPITPAFIELATRNLTRTQNKMQQLEPLNEWWFLEVKLVVDMAGQRYDVDLAQPDQIDWI
jgi:hypothetical protein